VTPIWVVQNCKDRQTEKILAALKEVGEPFILTARDIFTEFINFDEVDLIPYGSTSLLEFAKEHNWRYVFHNDNFRTDVYASRHSRMLNNDAMIMSLSAFKLLTETRPQWFIRPVLDLKSFAGFTAPSKEIVEWITRLEAVECEVDSNTLVSVASPKVIDMEWRYFIVDGKIITGSSYKHQKKSYIYEETDKKDLDEAQELAMEWLPHENCCMDVALWEDKPYVVEFNGLNSSGFYDHNVVALVRAVSTYAKLRS